MLRIARTIAAVRVATGLFCQLPEFSRLSVVGNGFNERTILVSCDSEKYIVFKADVQHAFLRVADSRAA